jgi:transketolase
MFAAHYKLDNLVAIIDNNGLQIDGKIEDVMSPYPIIDKFSAFGWFVTETDGHDFSGLEEAFSKCREIKGKPCVIVAHTVKGKGVSFMENNVDWHGTPPKEDAYLKALRELDDIAATLGQK